VHYLVPQSNRLPSFKQSLLLVLFAFAGAVCAQNQRPNHEVSPKDADTVRFAPDDLEPYGATFTSVAPPASDQSKVLIYRQGPRVKALPANIYIDKRYHASLLRGGYSEFCTSQRQGSLLAVIDDAQKMHMGKHGPAKNWTFQTGQTLFLKVEETGQISEVRPEQALRELATTALQTHTISRSPLLQECKVMPPQPVQAAAPVPVPAPVPVVQTIRTEPAPVKPPVPRLYALESDALFDFGKTQLRAKAYNEIEIMAQKLRQDFSKVERIRVIGHSDAIGQPAANIKLSLARAQVVADQLKERGIRPTKGFQIEGEGSRQLVKVNCGNAATPVNKLCHAPNRRVDIVVTGAKR
jgi:OOP family OmpA-OmpF porin